MSWSCIPIVTQCFGNVSPLRILLLYITMFWPCIPIWTQCFRHSSLYAYSYNIYTTILINVLPMYSLTRLAIVTQCVGHISPYTFTDCNTMCWPYIPLHIYRLQHDVLAIYPLTHLPIETRCVGRIYIPLLIANCNTMIWSCLPIVTHCVDYVSPHTFTYCITICWPCVTS